MPPAHWETPFYVFIIKHLDRIRFSCFTFWLYSGLKSVKVELRSLLCSCSVGVFQSSSGSTGSVRPHLLSVLPDHVLPQHGLHSNVAVLVWERQRDAGHRLDVSLHILGWTGVGKGRLGSPPDLLHLVRRRAAAHCCQTGKAGPFGSSMHH